MEWGYGVLGGRGSLSVDRVVTAYFRAFPKFSSVWHLVWPAVGEVYVREQVQRFSQCQSLPFLPHEIHEMNTLYWEKRKTLLHRQFNISTYITYYVLS